ncbi:unnamed protein product, partial [Laminaria digitata]
MLIDHIAKHPLTEHLQTERLQTNNSKLEYSNPFCWTLRQGITVYKGPQSFCAPFLPTFDSEGPVPIMIRDDGICGTSNPERSQVERGYLLLYLRAGTSPNS